MFTHSIFHKKRNIFLIGFAALFAILIFAPWRTYASGDSETDYQVSVTKVFASGLETEPVDITMTYSGSFALDSSGSDADSALPDTIQIYYDGEPCGTAVKAASVQSFSNSLSSQQQYSYTVGIPFHFSDYDPDTKSETITKEVNPSLFSTSYDNNTGVYRAAAANSADSADISVPDSAFIDLDAMKNSTFSESSQSGTSYDLSVSQQSGAQYGIMSLSSASANTLAFTAKNNKPETISIPVIKTWVGDPGESATVHLLADGTEVKSVTLTEDNAWTYTFEDLDKYDSDGDEIKYTLEEDSIDGYTSVIIDDAAHGFEVVNTQLISVNVKKVWVGEPGESATVHLYANGEPVEDQTLTITASTGWTDSFNGLNKVDDEGNDIEYTVAEDPVSGYSSSITGNAENGFIVTNTKTIDIPVQKVWMGDPADSATVHLFANGDEVASATLTENNGWTYTFEDLAQADSSGEITYTLTEDPIDGYTSSISGGATNGFTVTNTKTIDIPVQKVWVGDIIGDSFVRVSLLANGEVYASADLSPDNNWSCIFENVPTYDSEGNEIEFSVEEDSADGYTGVVDGDTINGFTVTNTTTIDIPVTKTWIGDTGESATVRLLANGTEVAHTTLTAENNWSYTFEDFARADTNGEITYTLTEDTIEGYTSSINGDADSGFIVTNTKTIDIPVNKTWIGDAAESATVRLLANGTEVANTTLTEDDGWTYTFEDLVQADSNGEITYTLTEDTVDGYITAITGDAESGFSVINVKEPAGILLLTATKTVNNETPDQSYTFCLLDENGNTLQTKQNDANGAIQFDLIIYGPEDIGTEFTYQVIEQAGSDENVTYDSSVYTISVTPYQDPDDPSAIIAVPTITKDGNEVSAITFNNIIEAESEEQETTETTESSEATETTEESETTAESESVSTETTPNTGDSAMPVFWTAAAAAAAAGIFLELRRRIRNQK